MNIEPEKELNDDDLVKFDKPIIEETDRPAWHFTLQKAAKAEYNQKQNWKFHFHFILHKNLKPILIAAMYKQSHSLNKRTTKSNFLFQSKTEFYKEKKTLLSTLLIFFNKN